MKTKKMTKLLLSSTCLSLLAAPAVMAEQSKSETAAQVVLDRVMVVGSEENIQDLTGSAHYIGEEALENFKTGDIHRALRQVPGVTIQEEEGFGNRPNIGIRGGRSERSADITLMEDGVLIAPAPYASSSAYFFPRVARMSAVEVRKGSSSIEFGPRTTSGAVNLISRQVPTDSEGQFLAGYGTDNAQRAQFNYGNTVGNYGFVFDLTHEATDGFKSIDVVGGDTGFSIQDVAAKFTYTVPETSKYFQTFEFKIGATEEDSDETYLGLTDEDFAADPHRRYASTQVDNMDADHQTYMIRHYIEPTDWLDVTSTIYRNDFARNWYKLQAVEVGGDKQNLGAALSSSTHLAALKGETDLDGGSDNNLVVRANNREYYSQGVQSNAAIKATTGDVDHLIKIGARYHYDEEDRFQQEDLYSITNGVMALSSAGAPGSNANRVASATATSLHILDEIDYGNWAFTPGVRYEHIELERENRANGQINTNDLDVIIPGLGAAYTFNDNWQVFGGVHKGFAPPSPSTNTSQREEESINYEIGARFGQNDLRAELVGYFVDYDNLLGEETLSSGGSGDGDQFNGGEVDAYGLELALGYDWKNLLKTSTKLPARFNYTFSVAEFQTDFESNFDEWGSVNKGDSLPYIPRNQFSYTQGVDADKWEVHASVTYVDEMRTTAGSGPIDDSNATDAHFVVDLAGEVDVFKQTRAFLTVDNLFDETYVAARRPAGARPGKPFTILAGLKYNF